MKVKSLRAHQNMHGAHKKGDEYEHRKPEADIAFGYVEPVAPEEKTEGEGAEDEPAFPTEATAKKAAPKAKK